MLTSNQMNGQFTWGRGHDLKFEKTRPIRADPLHHAVSLPHSEGGGHRNEASHAGTARLYQVRLRDENALIREKEG